MNNALAVTRHTNAWVDLTSAPAEMLLLKCPIRNPPPPVEGNFKELQGWFTTSGYVPQVKRSQRRASQGARIILVQAFKHESDREVEHRHALLITSRNSPALESSGKSLSKFCVWISFGSADARRRIISCTDGRSFGSLAQQAFINDQISSDNFQKNHLRRQKEYQDADAHYEERSQKAEAAREAIFLEGQRDRSRAFDIDQETRSKRSEWYSSARHMLLGEGHQRYKDKFIALENVLVEQFNGLLKGLGDTNQPSLPLHPDDHDQNFNDVSYKKIETSFRPRSPPSPALRPRTPTVWPTIATPSPEPIFTQPLVPSNYQLSPQRGRIQITEPVRAESAMNALQDQHLDIHSAFDNAQRKRQEHFSSQEQERERQFQAAETIREAGESGRDAEFTQRMEQWSKASQKLLAQNTTHSRGREEERLNWNRRRNAAFEATQERSRQVFEMSMLHIQRQAEAEEDFEDLWVKRQKTLIIALCKNQSIQISAGRFTQPYPDRDFSSYNPAVGRPLETTLSDNSSGSPSPEAPHRINSPLVCMSLNTVVPSSLKVVDVTCHGTADSSTTAKTRLDASLA
ncbi:hypothetical protein H0H93_004094 [Arthromyces matolae]|nr:hypothetical protein H0H93_004094 [Arthromyces matolae]